MIKFEHVYKQYSNGVLGLNDVNLEIQQGEFVAVIGLSGAGKSTLIRTVNKMIDITGGKLTVNGTDVSALSRRALRKFRRKIGMVFQSFNLVTRTSVINNVLSARVADMSFVRTLLGLNCSHWNLWIKSAYWKRPIHELISFQAVSSSVWHSPGRLPRIPKSF